MMMRLPPAVQICLSRIAAHATCWTGCAARLMRLAHDGGRAARVAPRVLHGPPNPSREDLQAAGGGGSREGCAGQQPSRAFLVKCFRPFPSPRARATAARTPRLRADPGPGARRHHGAARRSLRAHAHTRTGGLGRLSLARTLPRLACARLHAAPDSAAGGARTPASASFTPHPPQQTSAAPETGARSR